MEERVRALALILERMYVLYDRVLDVLDQEKKTLILVDFENLFKNIREKDEVLETLRALDKDRLRIQDQFALEHGLNSETLTLRTMAEFALKKQPSLTLHANRLLDVRVKLAEIIAEVKAKVHTNKFFTEASVKSLRGIAEEVSRVAGGKEKKSPKKSNVYTGKAKIKETVSRPGSLVEKSL